MKLSFYIFSGSFVQPFLLIPVLEKFMKIVDYHSTVKFRIELAVFPAFHILWYRIGLLHQPSRTTFLSLFFTQIESVRISGCFNVLRSCKSKFSSNRSEAPGNFHSLKSYFTNTEFISVFKQIQTIYYECKYHFEPFC